MGRHLLEPLAGYLHEGRSVPGAIVAAVVEYSVLGLSSDQRKCLGGRLAVVDHDGEIGDSGREADGFLGAPEARDRSGYSWHRYAPPHCSPRISNRSRNPGTGSAAPAKAKEL